MGGKVKEKKEKEEVKEEKKKEEKPKEKGRPKEETRLELTRLANTDLNADESLRMALTGIKGVSYAMSKAVCTVAGFDPKVKLKDLSEQDREKIEGVIYSPSKFGIPQWMLNRRQDIETGEDVHLIGADLEVAKRFDVQRMVDLKTWKGVRHMYGMPVRGQRTRSAHHKGKTVGVVRKAVRLQMQKTEGGGAAPAAAPKKEEKK